MDRTGLIVVAVIGVILAARLGARAVRNLIIAVIAGWVLVAGHLAVLAAALGLLALAGYWLSVRINPTVRCNRWRCNGGRHHSILFPGRTRACSACGGSGRRTAPVVQYLGTPRHRERLSNERDARSRNRNRFRERV